MKTNAQILKEVKEVLSERIKDKNLTALDVYQLVEGLGKIINLERERMD